MNNFEKKLKDAAKERYSLSSDERARMKDHVNQYMKIKPIRRRETIHYAFSSFYIAMRRTGAVVAVFAVIFVMGGLSAAANSALPGDVLYPIKHILEDARSTFTFSDESKAEWEVRRLERRIDEVALLEGMGELDIKKRERLEEHIAEHAGRVSELAQKVEGTDGIAAMNLRTNVAIELGTKGGADVQEESALSMATLSVQDDAAVRTMEAPESVSIMKDEAPVENASEYKEAATKQRDAVRELLSRIERQKGLVEVGLHAVSFEAHLLTPLASLRADMKEAEELYESGSYKESHDLFVEIHTVARELDLTLKRGSWRPNNEVSAVEEGSDIEENTEEKDENAISVDIDVVPEPEKEESVSVDTEGIDIEIETPDVTGGLFGE